MFVLHDYFSSENKPFQSKLVFISHVSPTHSIISVCQTSGVGKEPDQKEPLRHTSLCCCCYCSVTLSCPTLCNPVDCSTPGFPVLHYLLEFAQSHLILCHPLLLPSVFPSIRVFSSESALCIRWPKYWSFSFSISPSNEYSGLLSFKIDLGLISLLSKGLSRVFSSITVGKH